MDNNKKPIADAKERQAALDPSRSFIVQAPAGSGKTELLIQRYLKLLGTVSVPEEIIAITFTRKAAAEMRNRVLEALERGKNSTPPAEAHAQKTWELSQNALLQDNRFGWQIAQNPSRLKIQTIDSLCAGLTRQMPFLSKFGAQPEITDRPDALYREAARNTVAGLEAGTRWSPAIEALVRHLDNHLARIEALVAGMLSKRDQWLRHMVQTEDAGLQRKVLEQALIDVIEDALKDAKDKFPGPGLEILLSSARLAAKNLKKDGADSLICVWEDLTDLPGTTPSDVEKWLGLAELLLTGKGEWRKTVTKKTGFPAPSSAKNNSALKQELQEAKDTFLDYLQALEGEDRAADALNRVRMLPDPAYTDDQWHIMQALFEILKVAVGHLKVVFQAAGAVDFAEIGLRASIALGDPENPTDLSLALDYRISHILMDEFQDTSFTQYELIERLTGGWMPGDGRTFFAVGDPMQSIYAFREAEVGLFLNAWENGLTQVELTPLTLSVNFRSQQGIIDWVNDSFPKIMPGTVDITTGRVSYSPSSAFHPLLDGQAVTVHPFLPADREKEAGSVVKCVQKAKKENPNGTIAILVRGRSHLVNIVTALKAENIKFQAVEIDSLQNRPVITDLISLSRALSHVADRIAWLSVLRAPWCGMTLNDLYALVDGAPRQTVIELMQSPDRLTHLTPDGQKRLQRIREILIPAVEHRNQKPFRRLVQGVWILLGGPACVFEASEFEDAGVFFDLLEQHAGNDVLSDISALEDAAAVLFARPDLEADDTLQIMTIHKAKGLEFDTVILPGLERRPPASSTQLLLWLERAADHKKDLLLAPISETGSDKNKIYKYIQTIHDEKRSYEDARLLYVAATRAKKYLHLMGGVNISSKENEVKKPAPKTLLNSLWPAVDEIYYKMNQVIIKDKNQHDKNRPEPEIKDDEVPEPIVVPYIRRLTDTWHLPDPPADVKWTVGPDQPAEAKTVAEAPEFDWAGETARHVGIVAHVWLRVIAEQVASKWDAERVQSMAPMFKADLARSGVGADQIDAAAKQVADTLINAVTDDKGRWILSDHQENTCEYALTGTVDGQIVSVKIDRTFVDENNIRWIIDYKTGTHTGGSVEAFLDQEKLRYQDQLEMYKRLMGAKEEREVRLGLYFPRLKGWRSW
ncbi:MAG: UvrD-helicase domain-containing protein [Desulfobacteraceae bacterium]|nr:UvrD-helicase domain-containing protein [Desulfobacteraceae bacterium]MBC2757697.1 UvrD-helicase domain-containing protein [Desulfobacteraceae bacterium]